MPIAVNVSKFQSLPKGEGRAVTQPDGGGSPFPTFTASMMPTVVESIAKPATARPVAVAAPSPASVVTALQPAIVAQRPALAIRPELLATLLSRTTTQIARGTIKQLQEANPGVVEEAINTIKNRNITAGGLMNYLERKVKIGEVLNELARDWEDETKQDFAEAFNTALNKLNVMDSIVSIAVLNDPDLEEELRVENTPETGEADLLENRRVVWQYPPPGTPLDPPYLVLVAVEHQDIAKAEEVVKSIMDELVNYQGFKIPKATERKLRSR